MAKILNDKFGIVLTPEQVVKLKKIANYDAIWSPKTLDKVKAAIADPTDPKHKSSIEEVLFHVDGMKVADHYNVVAQTMASIKAKVLPPNPQEAFAKLLKKKYDVDLPANVIAQLDKAKLKNPQAALDLWSVSFPHIEAKLLGSSVGSNQFENALIDMMDTLPVDFPLDALDLQSVIDSTSNRWKLKGKGKPQTAPPPPPVDPFMADKVKLANVFYKKTNVMLPKTVLENTTVADLHYLTHSSFIGADLEEFKNNGPSSGLDYDYLVKGIPKLLGVDPKYLPDIYDETQVRMLAKAGKGKPPPGPPPGGTGSPSPTGKHTPEQKVIAKKKLFAKDLEKTFGVHIPPGSVQSVDELSIGAFKKNLGKALLADVEALAAGKPPPSGLMTEQVLEALYAEMGMPVAEVAAAVDLTLAKSGKPKPAKPTGPTPPPPPPPPTREEEEERKKAAEARAKLDALIDKYTSEIEVRFDDLKAKMVHAAMTFQNPSDLINYGEKIAGETFWHQALSRVLGGAVDLGAKYGIAGLTDVGFAFDWTMAHREAAEWARTYGFDLVRGIESHTRALLRSAVGDWIESGLPPEDLRNRLTPAFGKARAELIASTEATRAFNKGSHIIYTRSGVVSHMQWLTANDELVCPICGPLGGMKFDGAKSQPTSIKQQWTDGLAAELDGEFTHPGGQGDAAAFGGRTFGLPPAHPRCRCGIAPILSRLAFAKGVVLPPPPEGGAGGTSAEYRRDLLEFKSGEKFRGEINGVSLESQPPPDFNSLKDEVSEPPLPPLKGKRQSAGVVVLEPDGRMWVVEPSGHYGGYEHTFAKGGVEPGMTLQQTAIKEAYEEMGLNVKLEGYLSDAEGTTSMTRYYLARRVGGNPGDAHWETDKVKLATPDKLKGMLNTKRDQTTLAQALEAIEERKKPKKKEVDDDGFPLEEAMLSRLKVVTKLGGSTGAELVQDPQTGKKFVRKQGASEAHLREEAYADLTYQGMGVPVPKMRLYETKGRPTKLSEFIDDTVSLGSLKHSDPARYQRALAEVKKHFAADALLANWDVMGASYDNILVDNTNQVWRIDNGGALRYRAQGKAKPGWNGNVKELWNMRNPALSAEAGPLYKDVTVDEIASQLNGYLQRRAQALGHLPKELSDVLGARFDSAADFVDVHGKLRADSWSERYVDKFLKHTTFMQEEGIFDRLPKKLTRDPGSYSMEDENGKTWDSLRGKKSISESVWQYLDKSASGRAVAMGMMRDQAGDSWHSEAQAVKMMIAKERNNVGDYWWKRGPSKAEEHYNNTRSKYSLSEEQYIDSMSALHAFNFGVMRKVDFIHNDRSAGIVTLMRTEANDVMSLNGLSLGIGGKSKGKIKRGPSESTSVWKRVTVFGTENTVMQVPHHRVLGTYFLSADDNNYTIMAGDGENEFIAMLDGLESHYVENKVLKAKYGFELK